MKIGMLNGCIKNTTPEYEDCRKIAEAKELPLKLVYNAAINAMQSFKGTE